VIGGSAAIRWLVRVGIALVYVFLLAPIVVVVLISFSSDPILRFPPTGWSLQWYATLLGNRDFIGAAGVSLVVATGAALLAAAVAVPASLAIARNAFRGKALVEGVFLAPLLVPAIVIGLGLMLVFSPLGLRGSYLGLVLANAGLVIPYIMRTTLLSLTTLDRSAEEAARVLGATQLRVFGTVTLPLIAPGVLSGAILAFLLTFDEAVVSLFLVSSRVRTLPIEMFDYVQTRTDPQLAAVSTVLIVISLVVVVLVERVIGVRKALR